MFTAEPHHDAYALVQYPNVRYPNVQYPNVQYPNVRYPNVQGETPRGSWVRVMSESLGRIKHGGML